jgi:hypothetical protein
MARLAAFYARWRFLVLLVTLLLVLIVQPVAYGFTLTFLWFDVLLMLVTVALLLSFCPEKGSRLVAACLGVPAGLLSLGGHLLVGRPADTAIQIGHGLAVLFFFWGASLIVASLFRRQALSKDSVFGSICGYLLLGMAWGVLYSMLDAACPGSFEVADRLAEQVRAEHSRVPLFTYYSFITLTTVGYGDVTPVSAPARTFAWIEALTGQFYLAVLVAGLVGSLLSQRPEAGESATPGPGDGPATR